MSNITKRINRGIESGARVVIWDSSVDTNDAGTHIAAGDIFRVEDSLYRAGKSMALTASSGGAVGVRINSVVTVYPRRNQGEAGNLYAESYDLVASGREFTDTTVSTLTVAAGETLSFKKGEMNIRTVEVVVMSGSFRLIVD